MTWKPLPDRRQELPEPKTVTDSVSEWAKSYEHDDTQTWATIARLWADTVGEDLAEQASPHSFANGILVVAVADPGWVTHVQFLATKLAEMLNSALGTDLISGIEVRRVNFR